jgi:hypothetical protein
VQAFGLTARVNANSLAVTTVNSSIHKEVLRSTVVSKSRSQYITDHTVGAYTICIGMGCSRYMFRGAYPICIGKSGSRHPPGRLYNPIKFVLARAALGILRGHLQPCYRPTRTCPLHQTLRYQFLVSSSIGFCTTGQRLQRHSMQTDIQGTNERDQRKLWCRTVSPGYEHVSQWQGH